MIISLFFVVTKVFIGFLTLSFAMARGKGRGRSRKLIDSTTNQPQNSSSVDKQPSNPGDNVTENGQSLSDFQQVAYGRIKTITNEDVAILHLHAKENIALEGNGLICVAYGSCLILGATICAQESEIYYPIISAPLAPFCVTITGGSCEWGKERGKENMEKGEQLFRVKCKTKTIADALKPIVDKCKPGECVLLFRPSDQGYREQENDLRFARVNNGEKNIILQHATFMGSIKRFLSYMSIPTGASGAKEIVNGLLLPSASVLKHSRFSYWPEWGIVCSSLKELLELGQKSVPPRFMVTGARGVGKSMFARTIVNFCLSLSCCSTIVYIETDVGQAELNPPGLIAAHLVTVPKLGSSIARNCDPPFSAFFFGATSPSFDPHAYYRGVERVIRDARAVANSNGFPIVTNTHGWVSGTGLDLLQGIAKLLDPTLIFSLNFDNANREANKLVPAKTLSITSIYSSRSSSISSSQMREINMTSYFAPALHPGSSQYQLLKKAEAALFRVSLQKLELRIVGETLPNDCILMSLNGTIVGLSIVKDDWRCVGLGIVRAVCPERNELFICTPVRSLIQEVTGITMTTSLEVPQALVKGLAQADSAPYLLKDSITMSGAIKARGSLLRKGK